MDIKVKRIDSTIPLPEYDGRAACFDLICRESVTIQPKEIKLVPVNIVVKIPDGYALLVFVRSSTPMRKGLILANSVGIVDPFYCGDKDEVLVEFWNITDNPVEVKREEVLAQGMIIKHEPVVWKEVEAMGEQGVGGYNTDWFENQKE